MPSSRRTLRQRSPPCRARKRHFKAGQSLRHGLRPSHLPLTREANLRQSCCPPGRPQLCVIATPVGDDACTAPAGAFRRPTGPQGPALRLEIVPGDPAAAPTSPGGMNPAPTAHGERPANRGGRGCPGKRRAGCPHPAGPCGSANTLPHPEAAFQGGAILRHGLRPCHLPLTREANHALSQSQPGRPHLCVIATPVGDDACIVPGDPAAAPTSPGGINPAPTAHGERPANRDGRGHPGKRRAGCPHPAGPRGGALLPAAPGSGISRRGNPSVTACGRATTRYLRVQICGKAAPRREGCSFV